MTPKYPHLTTRTSHKLSLPDDERIVQIRTVRWIGYPQANKGLEKLEDLLSYPEIHRMPNLLIVGDTNNGKTMLVKQFCTEHPPDDNIEGEAAIVPVLYVQAPPIPDEGRFYSAILDRLHAPCRPTERVGTKQFQVMSILNQVGTRMLIIDEIHQILAGHLNKQRSFLNVIKCLGNELKISVVGVGTRDALRAIQTDEQLANRFERFQLSRWGLNKDFLRLLISFERLLPLYLPSNLHEKRLAEQIFLMSEGYIGEVARLLISAAVTAVRNGDEKIGSRILKELDWCPPSDRRQMPELEI
ncbi:TniB family NTP-binding protein [uncultured Pseudodesulfovibrio sp.]|uniref:TniB family NTP-binding protein n=1 Tax=uncultured Pseudodesulfovibrio sp. TaxID=2035858 RepID=UPI0029C973F0|nr:TniB family NTP-binding protein [uncultured Pseudodesulfovibrio sp.]